MGWDVGLGCWVGWLGWVVGLGIGYWVGRFGRLGVGWLSWVMGGWAVWAVGCWVVELGVERLGGWVFGV